MNTGIPSGMLAWADMARNCPVCGKEFFVTSQDWVYKRTTGKKNAGRVLVWFCSYGCMRKYEKGEAELHGRGRRLKAPSKAERVCEMLDKGLNMAEISRLTGISVGTVNYYRDRYWDGVTEREKFGLDDDSQGDDGSGACPDA